MNCLIIICSECKAVRNYIECKKENNEDILTALFNSSPLNYYCDYSTFENIPPDICTCNLDKITDMYLTAKDLKKSLTNVHDDTKIFYQRIEDTCFNDGGWITQPIHWQGGVYDNYVRAFSAHLSKTDAGEEVFIINAHY